MHTMDKKKICSNQYGTKLGYSETKWQTEWDRTIKGLTTKLCFPKVADRLKLKINVTPNLTMMVTGHGNIKSYL